uniref:Lebercilin LCA5 n=1 Tax=Leptobrachium leishanense TaxID=445787 RepID=A0A8C5WMH4_9ANUR
MSDRSPTSSLKSRSPRGKKFNQKIRSSTQEHSRGFKKAGSKFPSSKHVSHQGFRSQSLSKESPPKDMDLVTKRVLSARLLKINELRNEVTQLQMKLEELQKENKTLKKLQYRQEKALNKFEDTESEISQLISRHNNEIRALREHLRKSQEKERAAEKKLKETEDELYRTNTTLKKLKLLSENRQLAEREELTRKVDLLEIRLDERDRKVKDLEKNIELTQSSFQRQLQSERKKALDAQEENNVLKEELQRLTQKLKEKERELDVKNIYAYRLSKPSSKKHSEAMQRRKEKNQSLSPGFLTSKHSSTEFIPTSPLPSPPAALVDDMEENQQGTLKMEQQNLEKLLREEAEKLQREKEMTERKREQEEKLRKEQEMKSLEDKARILREEWEQEELERKRKADLQYLSKLEKEGDINPTEEKRKKELLLAKLFEIDKENQDTFPSTLTKSPSQTSQTDSFLQLDTAKTKQKNYTFSEPTQKLYSGFPVYDTRDSMGKNETAVRRNQSDITADISFGDYTPTLVKGRSATVDQKAGVLEDPIIISNTKLNIQKDKKSNLLEQLFGSSPGTTFPSIAKANDSSSFAGGNAKANQESRNSLLWDKTSENKKDANLFNLNGKNPNSNPHGTQTPVGRPFIKAVEFSEDDIEEVVL